MLHKRQSSVTATMWSFLSTAGNVAVGWVSHVVSTPEGWLPAGVAQAPFAAFIFQTDCLSIKDQKNARTCQYKESSFGY